jgi:hypothetical protein
MVPHNELSGQELIKRLRSLRPITKSFKSYTKSANQSGNLIDALLKYSRFIIEQGQASLIDGPTFSLLFGIFINNRVDIFCVATIRGVTGSIYE